MRSMPPGAASLLWTVQHAPSVARVPVLLVVDGAVADPIGCDAISEILGTAFDHSYEGEDAEDIERREHGRMEGGADLRA